MPSSPAISSTGLQVSRGKSRHANHVLHDLSFTIPAGSITGLLGPSGCGKTTLMRAVVGLQNYSGELQVLGHEAGARELRGRTGYVTQSPSLYPELTIKENLAYFSSLSGGSPGDVAQALGLSDVYDRRVSSLSGGQRGRASLGCALVSNPELLIMDEPTVGLDPLVRVNLWKQFKALADAGTTLLISSHVMEEAGQCDQLILLREGRIVWQGTPGNLLETTGADTYEQAFLATITTSENQR